MFHRKSRQMYAGFVSFLKLIDLCIIFGGQQSVASLSLWTLNNRARENMRPMCSLGEMGVKDTD